MTDEENVRRKIKELEGHLLKKQGKLLQFWGKSLSTAKVPVAIPAPLSQLASSQKEPDVTTAALTSSATKRSAPVQESLRTQLNDVNSQVLFLSDRRNSGLLTDDEHAKLECLRNKKIKLEKSIKLKEDEAIQQQKHREKTKQAKLQLVKEIPEAGKYFSFRNSAGRPRIEEEQPSMLKTICDIALHGSAAHDRRHDESVRSVKTLNELTLALQSKGFSIKRSATYLRLIPRRADSSEGKRHISTVPVKLLRASNTKHQDHLDGRFCTASIRSLEELASLLGPNEAGVISQDDKARVAIGLAAANKQAPILMHVEYKVTLPDHDWVVANKHKLIPSVYAAIEIKPNGLGRPEAVGYSGPTYIAIRSGKHSSSTAYSHALDFGRLLCLESFENLMKFDGLIKPVLIFIVDGGPDENPRYRKVIQVAIHHFKEHNLDALFIATNAPGRSAFNRVERRMAPLSKELAGLVIPHDHFGSHLDSQLRTTDSDLEKRNFKFAGQLLADTWNELTIDGYPTVAEYVEPDSSEADPDLYNEFDQSWFAAHVRTSQYLLQIVKCSDRNCCSPVRSSIQNVLQNRFLPPPVSLSQTSHGLIGSLKDETLHFPSMFVLNSMQIDKMLPKSARAYKMIPYDMYCTSVKPILNDRICCTCGLYFASVVMLREHRRLHKANSTPVPPADKRVRPIRVAAKRQREWMAVVARGENMDCEWMDEDDLDLSDLPKSSRHRCH